MVRRNQDFAEISKRLAFSYSQDQVSVYSMQYYNRWLENEIRDVNSSRRSLSMHDSDIVIWMGDLNYRINLPEDEAKALIQKGNYKKLLVFDQLNLERKAQRVFSEFDEAQIDFPPTYKFDPGTDIYDTSEKKRTPSWCDRVLWRKSPNIQCKEYVGVPNLLMSDHKPVRAVLEMKVQYHYAAQIRLLTHYIWQIKYIIKQTYEDVHQQIIRNLDRFENDCIPDAVLSQNTMDFGNVKYMQAKSISIAVENVGQVIAELVPSHTHSNSDLITYPIIEIYRKAKRKVHFKTLALRLPHGQFDIAGGKGYH